MMKFALVLFAVISVVACQNKQSDKENDLDDRYGFNPRWPDDFMRPNPGWNRPAEPWGPNPGWNRPADPWGPNPTRPVPTRPPTQPTTQASGSTTQSPDIQACLLSCPATPEYNPVCGSNGQTYDNPGRLGCAQQCGVSVRMVLQSRCPASTPAPTS